jgi:integrase
MGIRIRNLDTNLWHLTVKVYCPKEVKKRETFSGTKSEAHDRGFEILKELKNGSSVPPPTYNAKTFGDILGIYKSKSRSFSVPHQSRFNQLLKALGDVPLSMFPERLEAYLKLRSETPSRIKKGLSDASINRLTQLVMAAFNKAVEIEILDKNPISRARFPKYKETPRDVIISKKDLARLLDIIAIEASHLEAIVRYNFQVPCRKSELINMRMEDLDLINNAIRVRNGKTKNDAGIWKPIPPDMVGYFRSIPPGCPYLFYRFEKGVYKPLGDFKTAWKRCLRLAGLPDLHFHDGRHTSASNLVDNGTPDRVVMQVAGWRTDMLRIYYNRSGKQSFGLLKFSESCGGPQPTYQGDGFLSKTSGRF